MPGTALSFAASSKLILTVMLRGWQSSFPSYRGEETEAQMGYRETAQGGGRADLGLSDPHACALYAKRPWGCGGEMTKMQIARCSSRSAESECLGVGPRNQSRKASGILTGLSEV